MNQPINLKRSILPLLAAALTFGALVPQTVFADPPAIPAKPDYVNGTTMCGVDSNFTPIGILPKNLVVGFNWKTTVDSNAGGQWNVTTSGTAPPAASGTVPPLAPGAIGSFTIDFSSALKANPSTTTFYVRIAPINAQGQINSSPSNLVQIKRVI